MRYHHGVLRHKHDSTLRLKTHAHKHKLTCMQYLPLVVLGVLLAGLFLLMKSIFLTSQIIQ